MRILLARIFGLIDRPVYRGPSSLLVYISSTMREPDTSPTRINKRIFRAIVETRQRGEL